MLLTPETLAALAGLGLEKYGLITGRSGVEVEWALRMLAPEGEALAVSGMRGSERHPPFGVIVPADLYAKPDPEALLYALRALGSRAAVYVGDTSDDLDLALRYRAERVAEDASLPRTLAVCVATGETERVYRERGADITLSHISELPAALATLRMR